MFLEKVIIVIYGMLLLGGLANSIIALVAIGKTRRAFAESEDAAGFAGLWERSAAYGVDYLIVYLLLLLWLFLLGVLESWRVVDGRVWLAFIIGLFIPLVYFTIPYMRGKQTWGKKATGLTMELATGEACGGWRALARATLREVLSALAGILFVLADALVLVFHPQKRSLRDLMVGTRVRQTARPPLLAAVAPLACSVVLVMMIVMMRSTILQTFFIPSPSMIPTLQVGDRLVANKLCYRIATVKRGDIIIFHPSQAYLDTAMATEMHTVKDEYLIKRVVALPGETVNIKAGEGIFINGKLQPDQFATAEYDWPTDKNFTPLPPYQMGPEEYFVLGDNRNNSYDSHAWHDPAGRPAPGVPLRNIVGRASLRYLPFGRIGALD